MECIISTVNRMEIQVEALSQDRCVKGLAELVGQVASTNNYVIGASSMSAIVLSKEIIVEACKSPAAGLNGMGLYRAAYAITTNIKSGVRKVNAPIESMQLATIFVNGQREIGEMMENGHGVERFGISGDLSCKFWFKIGKLKKEKKKKEVGELW